MTTECLVAWLGQDVDYQRAWDLQRGLAAARSQGRIPDVLLLLEHVHVYTIGRRGNRHDVLLDEDGLRRVGASLYHTDRGGQVTYHGPGQLVGYPIILLLEHGMGPLAYVRALEEVLVRTLADFGIRGERVPGLTGVWVKNAKIAAIGARISAGVTMHGFALNVAPDLGYFDHIVPCGIRDRGVTSMACLLGQIVDTQDVAGALEGRFADVFGCFTTRATPGLLEETLSALTGGYPVVP